MAWLLLLPASFGSLAYLLLQQTRKRVVGVTDKRTDVWSRHACIYTQIFSPEKTGLKSCSAQTLLFHSPAQTTAHSTELIFHIMKSRDQTSVLLSVVGVVPGRLLEQ